MKHINKFLSLVQELKSTTGINREGIQQALRLATDKEVIKPNSWERPSAEQENQYIMKNGIVEFSKWFLGVDSNVDPKTKGHWTYIYTSDFKNVDRAGLIAIRQRAGQNGETAIFNAAGKILDIIDK
jgi:hypothetical protein